MSGFISSFFFPFPHFKYSFTKAEATDRVGQPVNKRSQGSYSQGHNDTIAASTHWIMMERAITNRPYKYH